MAEFDENKHPRDKGGKFTHKANSKADKLEEAESIYSDDAPRAVNAKPNKNNKSYRRLKNKIQSAVFNRISSVRGRFRKRRICNNNC